MIQKQPRNVEYLLRDAAEHAERLTTQRDVWVDICVESSGIRVRARTYSFGVDAGLSWAELRYARGNPVLAAVNRTVDGVDAAHAEHPDAPRNSAEVDDAD